MSQFEVEPNNSRIAATPWNFGEVISGQLSTFSDQDYFKINVNESGIFTLSFDSPTDSSFSSTFEVGIFNASGTLLNLYSTGRDSVYNFALHRAGEYVIVIASAASYSGGNYNLSGRFVASPVNNFEREPNDSI